MTPTPLLDRVHAAGLKPMRLGDRELLPIVQGGMGVGISAHRLAGSVAAQGAWGTIASVDLRRHHPDLMARSEGLSDADERKKEVIQQANQEALVREIRQARALAGGRGLLAVNVMRAVSDYAASVRTALQEGIDALVVGAGLPLDLPELAQDHPDTALVPILSDARGVALLWKKWERRQRLPSAIVIEHPAHAAGHLGAAKVADLGDARFEFETVLPAVRQHLRMAVNRRHQRRAGLRHDSSIRWADGAEDPRSRLLGELRSPARDSFAVRWTLGREHLSRLPRTGRARGRWRRCGIRAPASARHLGARRDPARGCRRNRSATR